MTQIRLSDLIQNKIYLVANSGNMVKANFKEIIETPQRRHSLKMYCFELLEGGLITLHPEEVLELVKDSDQLVFNFRSLIVLQNILERTDSGNWLYSLYQSSGMSWQEYIKSLDVDELENMIETLTELRLFDLQNDTEKETLGELLGYCHHRMSEIV